MVCMETPFAHQRVRDGHFQRFGERGEFGRCSSGQDAAAGIQERAFRGRKRIDNALGDHLVDRRPRHRCRHLLEGVDRQIL